MLKRALVLAVVACSSSSGVFAADLRQAVDAAARTAAAQQPAQQETQMAPLFKWMGIALMVEGGLVAAAPCTFLGVRNECRIIEGVEPAGRIAGLSMVGAGAVVFWIGTKRRVPVDNLTFGPRGRNGWFVQQKVKF
jgi:hypothetical protein